jgi:anti-sigma-K factor RskA
MAYSEDHIALAAEYALGTLDDGERTQVETMMAVDSDFMAIVQSWEFRLGVLNQMVGSIEPSPEVWDKIRIAVGLSGVSAPLVQSEAPPPPPQFAPEADAPELVSPQVVPSEIVASEVVAPEVVAPEVLPSELVSSEVSSSRAVSAQVDAPRVDTPRTVTPVSAADNDNVILFAKRARRWRNVASFTTAIAAALVAMIAVGTYQPDLLPAALRPKPRVQLVEVKSPPLPAQPSAQYVAVLQKDGGSPAFILTVDGATRNFTVRRVDAASEPGKSYELWVISDRLGAPRSLGVIGEGDFTARPALAAYDSSIVRNATYAVTVEPSGGSPNGKPSGAPVFTGKLIETVPQATSR